MIRILTDSTADLPPRRRARLQVESLSMSVRFGEECFRDGVDMTHEQFYQRLASSAELPQTSQVNPDEFAATFTSFLRSGDTVVGVFLSSELSGTFQSATIAKNMVPNGERIHLVDSRSVAFGLGLLVEQACLLRDQGCSAEEIARQIEGKKEKLRVYAVLDTLKYLKMGGRISATTAVVGGLMGICPVVTTEEGKVEMAGKARGARNAYALVAEKMRQDGVDAAYPIAFGHADCLDRLERFRAALPVPEGRDVRISPIGSAIGTHVGPGAVGVGYWMP